MVYYVMLVTVAVVTPWDASWLIDIAECLARFDALPLGDGLLCVADTLGLHRREEKRLKTLVRHLVAILILFDTYLMASRESGR